MSGRQIIILEPYLKDSSPGARHRLRMGRPLVCCTERAAWVQAERMLASMAGVVGVRIVLAQPGTDSADVEFLGSVGRVPNDVK